MSDVTISMQTCPACGTANPPVVRYCECGQKMPEAPSGALPFHPAALMLIGPGFGLVIWGVFFFRTAVGEGYGSVENIGLLQRQMIMFQAGAAMALAGCILLVADKILEALSGILPRCQAQALGSVTSSSAGTETE